jgi:hypothetical protein
MKFVTSREQCEEFKWSSGSRATVVLAKCKDSHSIKIVLQELENVKRESTAATRKQLGQLAQIPPLPDPNQLWIFHSSEKFSPHICRLQRSEEVAPLRLHPETLKHWSFEIPKLCSVASSSVQCDICQT